MLNKYGWNSKRSFNGDSGQKSSDQGRVMKDVPHITVFFFFFKCCACIAVLATMDLHLFLSLVACSISYTDFCSIHADGVLLIKLVFVFVLLCVT